MAQGTVHCSIRYLKVLYLYLCQKYDKVSVVDAVPDHLDLFVPLLVVLVKCFDHLLLSEASPLGKPVVTILD